MPMSVTECIKAVMKQLSDEGIGLKDADEAEIMHQLGELAASTQQGMPLPLESLEKLVAQARNKALANAYRKRKTAIKQKENDLMVRTHTATELGQLESVMDSIYQEASPTRSPNPFQMPVVDRMHTDVLDLKRRTNDVFEAYAKKHPGTDVRTDPTKMKAVLRYAAGEDGLDADLKPIGVFYRQQFDELHLREKAAGSTEGYIPNYLPRDTDVARISTLEHTITDEYAQFLRDRMDPVWHPDTEVSVAAIYKGQVDSQMYNDFEAATQSGGTGTRQLHLKTAEDDIEYLIRFGKHDPLTALDASLERKTRNLAMHEMWGQDGISNMVKLAKDARQRAIDADVNLVNRARIDKVAKQIDARIAAMRALGSETKNTTLAEMEGLMYALNNSAMLGKVVISQMFDVVNTTWNVARLKGHGVHRNIDGMLANWQQVSDPVKKAALEAQNLQQAMFTGSIASRYVPSAAYAASAPGLKTATGVAKVTRGLNSITSWMMKYGGADVITDALHKYNWNSYTSMMADAALEGIQFRDLAGWNPEFALRLKEAGVSERSFNAVVHSQHVQGDVASGFRTIDFDAVQDRRARSEMLGFIGREAMFGVSRPDLMSKYYAGQLTNHGSTLGMAHRVLMQYQAMQMSVIRNTMMRAARGGVWSTASLMAPLFAAGLLKVQFDQWASDQPLYKPESSLLYTAALDRSNVLGMVGSLVHSGNEARVMRGEAEPFSVLANSLGPVAGTFSKTGKTLTRAAFDGEVSDKTQLDLTKLVWNNTPAHNFVVFSHWLPMLANEVYDDVYTAPNRRASEEKRGLYGR